jgi:hypothetical protein
MAVAWPTIRARLAAALPAVVGPDVRVYNGPVVTGDTPPAYLTVADQPSVEDESAGTYEQAQTLDGYAAQETGTVLMELAAVTGDTVVPDAFATASAISAWVQADQTLGVLSPGSTSSLSVEVLQAQNKAGAVQRLLLTLNYFTRLERTP